MKRRTRGVDPAAHVVPGSWIPRASRRRAEDRLPLAGALPIDADVQASATPRRPRRRAMDRHHAPRRAAFYQDQPAALAEAAVRRARPIRPRPKIPCHPRIWCYWNKPPVYRWPARPALRAAGVRRDTGRRRDRDLRDANDEPARLREQTDPDPRVHLMRRCRASRGQRLAALAESRPLPARGVTPSTRAWRAPSCSAPTGPRGSLHAGAPYHPGGHPPWEGAEAERALRAADGRGARSRRRRLRVQACSAHGGDPEVARCCMRASRTRDGPASWRAPTRARSTRGKRRWPRSSGCVSTRW